MSTPTSTVPPPPKVERNGNVTILTFTAGVLRDVENVIGRELNGHAIGGAECHLLLDFTHVRYLNSIELGTLLSLHKRIRDADGQLTLFNLDAQIRRLFAITRLDTLLAICREEIDPDADQPAE